MSKPQESNPNLQKARLDLEGYDRSLKHYQKYLEEARKKIKRFSIFPVNKTQEIEKYANHKLVHCVILTFYFQEILERCLESLLPEQNRIDVSVIENSSVNSDGIRKVIDLYRKKGLVKNHFIFEENIGTNALEIAFDSKLLDLDYQFITVTDGDLIPDKGWLDKQIKILNQYAEVFSVSSDLYYHNAPPPIRQAITKISVESENEIYKERLAGWWLKTFRGKDWQDFMTFRKANNIFFHDKSAYDYGKLKRNMKSVLAKSFKSYHLTWDYVNEDYMKMKGSLKGKTRDPWYHDRYSSFKLITIDEQELSFPAPAEVAHQRIDNVEKQVKFQLPVFTEASEYCSYAENQKRLGNQKEAIFGYRKAIEIQPQGGYYYELALLLVEIKQKWEEVLLCYEKLLEIKPWVGSHIKQCLELGTILVKKGKLENVISSYHNVFQKKMENLWYYWRFSAYLSNLGLLKEAVAFFGEFPKPNLAKKLNKQEELKESPELPKYDLVWDWFNSHNCKEFNLDIDLDSLKLEANKIEDHFQQKKISVFVLPHLKLEDKKSLQNLGISLEYVALMNQEDGGVENIYLNAFQDENSSKNSGYIQRNVLYPHRYFRCWHRINNPVEFPHTIAEFKFMYCFDPISGEIVRTNESFFCGSFIFYRFQGRETFYLTVGGFGGEKICLYIPKTSLVIYYNEWDVPPTKSFQIFQDFQSLIVTYFKDVLEYLNSSKSRSLTSCLGFIDNLGHYFWQDLNGIYYCYKNNLFNKIERFALGDYEKMELISIFPEIPERKIFKVVDMSRSERFQFFLRNNCFCFRITENFISNECMDRVRSVALEKCSADFISMVTKIKENQEHFPLLLINVRSHNKSWISQEEGYANIINKLREDFPNIGIVFDGWIDCNKVVESIKAQIKPHIKVYKTLGCDLHESIIWGYYIDAYIGVVGSGLTITSWLNDKPGVAYANRGHIRQKIFWSEVKENAIAPTFLDAENIVDVGAGGWGNYQLDWQVIYNKILLIIKKIEAEKSQITR